MDISMMKLRANKKYLKESVEDIRIRVPKGQKTIIKKHAEQQGESMNGIAKFLKKKKFIYHRPMQLKKA